MPDTPTSLITHMAAMHARHQSLARRYAAQIERHARQITLDLARGQSVMGLLQRMAEYELLLRDQQRAMDIIDEWAARMRRAAA